MTFILYKLLEIAKLKFSFCHLTTKKRRIKGVQINVESAHITLILCHQTIGYVVASILSSGEKRRDVKGSYYIENYVSFGQVGPHSAVD